MNTGSGTSLPFNSGLLTHLLSGLLLVAMTGIVPVPAEAQVHASFEPTERLKVPESESFGFTVRTRVSRLPDGGYVAAPLTELGRLAWFDSRGNFLRMTGRAGEGPGELGLIQTVAALPDGRVAIAENRLSILVTGQNLAVKQARGNESREIIGVTPNEVIVNKLLMPGAQGAPFVVWSRNLDSLRAIPDPFRGLTGDPTFRRIARRDDNSVVVSPVTAYEFAVLNLRNGITRMVPVSDVRFPSAMFMSLDRRQPHVARPYSRILALSVRGVDTLVVIYAQAAKNWAPAPKPTSSSRVSPEGGLVSPADITKYLSFVADVIDLRNGHSLGQSELKAPIASFASPEIAYSIEQTPDGDLYMQLFQLKLTTVRQPPKK